MDGILLLDKPSGITSNKALQTIKRLFRARKAGHTGSLDPLANGMLPICLGEATKFSHYLLQADKRYRVVAQLGKTTTTGDAEGEVTKHRPVADYSIDHLEKTLANFRGAIQQIPSMFSALKHQGRPLYELARQGITVERAARTVHIYELILLAHTHDTLTLEVACSKGTYIRTLVEDIGEALGCGAYVADLRRLTVSSFPEDKMIPLRTIEELARAHQLVPDDYILPIDFGLEHWPVVTLSDAALFYIKRGQAVIIPQAPASGWVRLKRANGQFLGIGEILDDGRVTPRRLLQIS